MGQLKQIMPLVFAGILGAVASTADTLTATPTFNNIGVEVGFNVAPTNGTQVSMFIKKAADPGPYRPIQPLSRTSPTNFAGSAFRLVDSTAYSIRLDSTAFASNQYLTVNTRLDAFAAATGATYHVAPSGNDTNSGASFPMALRTLGAALSKADAGNQILLHSGRYYEGDLFAPRSGTPAQPIVIRNAPGAEPILDGTDTNFVPSWSLYDAPHGVYRTPCAATPENAYLNGNQLFHYLDLSDLATNKWNQPGGYFVDGVHLYVRFPGGAPPGSQSVTIPRFTTGLTLDTQSNIHVIGLEFCYYGYGIYHRGIYLDTAVSNLVDQCFFHHVGIGVALKRAARFNTIQRCRFTESPVGAWSWHAVKDGGVGYEAGGVAVYASDQANVGNVIRHNLFTNLFDGSNVGSDNRDGPTKNLDFHNNHIADCGDDGTEADGAGINNRFYDNTFDRCLTGISVAPCALGPTYIVRNVISNWRPAEEFEGYPFKFNVNSALNIQWVYLYHNTCSTPVPGQNGFLFKNYSDWTNIVSRNNIFAGTAYALSSWSAVNPVDFDYDNLYTTNGAKFARWAGADYGSLAAFQAATGQEQHGRAFAPLFVGAAAGDFRLRHNSPLIDKGVLIPGINDDYVGSAPDIGAFEFVAEATNTAVSGSARLSHWAAVSAGVYRIQYTTNLAAAGWTNAGGNAVTAGAPSLTVLDPEPAVPQRFHRLEAVQ